jgi:hypothetical protein
MDFKTGKLHKIIREFKKGNGRYEINGIDLENTVFLYREKTSPFIPIPKGNYRTVSNDNKNTLIVDDYINNKAVEFQIISIFNAQASKYLEKFPELSMVVEHTNKIVDDINNIIGYLNSVGVKTDSKYQTQILTPLEPSSTWYMNADGVIETLPLDDFNKKFKEIIENISETADEKAQEQVRKRLEILKEEIENKMPEINNKFNSIAGGQLNPSFIQDVGEKRTGQFYLDRNTGRLYKCIKTTSSTINSAECFKDYSLEAIISDLESLTETGSNEKGSWFKDKRTGLIIQWGFIDLTVTKQDYEEHSVDLPIPFPNSSYNTSVTRNYNYHNISDGKWSCHSATNNKIKILTSGFTYNFGKHDTYFWIAIGR